MSKTLNPHFRTDGIKRAHFRSVAYRELKCAHLWIFFLSDSQKKSLSCVYLVIYTFSLTILIKSNILTYTSHVCVYIYTFTFYFLILTSDNISNAFLSGCQFFFI